MGQQLRVLVVDHDPADLAGSRRLLAGEKRRKLTIEGATGLEQALQALRMRRYDVLLLELDLPGSRGLATLDSIRSENTDVPIIVLSSSSDEETTLRSLDHGAQEYLVKGNVTTEILVRSIRCAIQRQQLVQEITNAKEMLERKNQRLANLYETAHRFVDNVSHEFRTPLTVIKEYTSLVRDGFVESVDEQRRFLDIVTDRADDLNTMVDDMLDVSKLEAGLLGAWRKACVMSKIVEDLRPALERKAALRGVTLEIDVDPSLPHVYCDSEKVGRVLINLTVNAIKFCQQDGHVRIWAKESAESAGVLVGVSDNGLGIDDESLAKIFERFQQVEGNVRGSCKGFGLGLNIAKELVDLNFGDMDVESQVDQGSTFTFTLPFNDPFEVMRRYLQRIVHFRNGSTKVSLIMAIPDAASESSVPEEVNAYLNSLLRRNDLVFQIHDQEWLIALAANETEVPAFYAKATKTLNDLNRNRIHGPLPSVELQTLGTWQVVAQSGEVMEQLAHVLEQEEYRSCPSTC